MVYRSAYRLAWDKNGWEDYLYWQKQDKKTLKRINRLIQNVLIDPFAGIGKPEPLRENLSGARIGDSPVVEDDRAWTKGLPACVSPACPGGHRLPKAVGRLQPSSDARRASRVCAASRRIDETNRLVYSVSDRYITVISCRYHY